MTADDLPEIAASVAKALWLGETYKVSKSEGGKPIAFWDRSNPIDDRHYLEADGSNLFAPYWQVRCRDWLLERNHNVCFNYSRNAGHWLDMPVTVSLRCPASEFCARAIHEIVKEPK